MVIRFLGKRLSSFQIIIAGFLGTILVGALLLMLPIAVRDGQSASIEDALFTATSAVCVTGLVIRDTASYWSGFGQTVILILIQTGGLGVVTIAAFAAAVSGKRISLLERSMLQDSLSAHQLGEVVKMTIFIFKVALMTEAFGTLLMLPSFCRRYGPYGIWMAVFHSVSAFCNAGFDIMGDKTGTFSSLTSFASDPGIVLPICLLIIIGGVGFLTWKDISVNKLHFRRYRMQSKVVLVMTGTLIVIPALLLFLYEYRAADMQDGILFSLFQSVTTRTAGFNTADLSSLSGAGTMLFITLMLIGGSPGSTAGGMKTTTAAVLFANSFSVFRRKKSAQLFGRRIEEDTVRNAATLFLLYLTLPMIGAAIISIAEGFPIDTCLFETVSAIGTVGLSMGITPSLGPVSRLVLILLMFFGRVGGLTLIYAAIHRNPSNVSRRPVEKIIVG